MRDFPIPRLRIQNVEITTPVVIDKVDEKALAAAQKPLEIGVLRKSIDEVLASNLKKKGLSLPAEKVSLIKKSLDDKTTVLSKPAVPSTRSVEIGTEDATDELSGELDNQLRKIGEKEPALLKNIEIESFLQDMRKDLKAKIISLKPPTPSVEVLINSSQIKEMGLKEAITYFKFTITENAMEWTEYQTSTGEKKEKLVPE